MPISITCDWCGDPITGNWMELNPAGHLKGGQRVELRARTYHTANHYRPEDSTDPGGGFYIESCIGRVLQLLDGNRDFAVPDAGFEWKLVPVSEGINTVYQPNTYTEPVLGVTPLADLDLDPATYKAVTNFGVFTVEHAADSRACSAGRLKLLPPKRMAALDAALVRRGLLGNDKASAGPDRTDVA